MTDVQLRKLNRSDLLELLIDQGKEMEALRQRLHQTEEQLASRRICMEEAGSIAEASLLLNGVFGAAQTAADMYLESIRTKSRETEERCAAMETESREAAGKMIAEARERAELLERETAVACRRMVDEAEKEAQKYWQEVSRRLEVFYEEHAALRELLAIGRPKGAGDAER